VYQEPDLDLKLITVTFYSELLNAGQFRYPIPDYPLLTSTDSFILCIRANNLHWLLFLLLPYFFRNVWWALHFSGFQGFNYY